MTQTPPTLCCTCTAMSDCHVQTLPNLLSLHKEVNLFKSVDEYVITVREIEPVRS